MAHKTVLQNVDLYRAVKTAMSSLNIQKGVIGQYMHDIEDKLRGAGIEYKDVELCDVVNKLVQSGSYTIHFTQDKSRDKEKYFVTLMSKV